MGYQENRKKLNASRRNNIRTNKKGERSLFSRTLGVVDAVFDNTFDFDGLGRGKAIDQAIDKSKVVKSKMDDYGISRDKANALVNNKVVETTINTDGTIVEKIKKDQTEQTEKKTSNKNKSIFNTSIKGE